MVAKQNDTRLRKHIRLINNNKRSSLLDKDYRDDDTEEYEEIFLESYVRFTWDPNQQLHSLSFLFRNIFKLHKTTSIIFGLSLNLKRKESFRRKLRSVQRLSSKSVRLGNPNEFPRHPNCRLMRSRNCSTSSQRPTTDSKLRRQSGESRRKMMSSTRSFWGISRFNS